MKAKQSSIRDSSLMTKYLSDKLTILYTMLIVMVVYIHSYYLEAEKYPAAEFLQILTGGICGIANPLFFSISGYLFARNISSLGDVFSKIKKRLRTLLVPYILWNLIFVLWYVVLEFIPGVSRFNNNQGCLKNLIDVPIWKCFYNLFVAPAAFQLWFLRDLIVFMLLTPLLWWISRRQWVISGVLAIVSSFFIPWLVYFWLGILLGTYRCDMENYPRNIWLSVVCALIFIATTTAFKINLIHLRALETAASLAGLYAVWSLYDYISCGRCFSHKGVWKYVCGYSFFIYCFHEPTLNIIKKLALAVFGVSEPVLIIFYFINPLLMVAFAVIVARMLQRITPGIYSILTGGR